MKLTPSLMFVLLVLVLTPATFSDTIVPGGTVHGTWDIGSSPYIVQGDVTITDSNTLTIEPGVEVQFETGTGAEFTVNGTLVAIGDVNDPILFTSARNDPNAGDWKQISVRGSNPKKSFFAHCIIEYAEVGIYCRSSSPSITNCTIQHNGTGYYS